MATKTKTIAQQLRKASRELHAGVGGRAGRHGSKKGAKGYRRRAKHSKKNQQDS